MLKYLVRAPIFKISLHQENVAPVGLTYVVNTIDFGPLKGI